MTRPCRQPFEDRSARRARCGAAGLAVLALLMLVGCRRAEESETPPDAPSTLGGPQSAAAESVPTAMPTPTGTAADVPRHLPAEAGDLPEELGGCFAGECHRDLRQATFRHRPVQDGACDVCHGPEQPDHQFTLSRTGTDMCTFCHPVVGHHEHVHAVIANEGCLPCHDPHGSGTRFLLTAPSTELTCRQCHGIERRAHLHGPFAGGDCSTCHEPHESDNAFLLLGGDGKEHCLGCHQSIKQRLLTAATTHAPVADGCVACHDPHSSDNAYVLTAPVEELCFGCHETIKGEVAGAAAPHGAVFTGHRCANCHDPHAADHASLLRGDLKALCLSCHDKPQAAYDGRTIPDMRPVLTDRKTLHGPVRSGECNACHDVHGSRYSKLLRQNFPAEFYQAFDVADYALCFDCHAKGMVLKETTVTLTGFRDGDRNLHYLHVNRPDKGRTCRTCHEIHGSNLPTHIASAVPFEGGSWTMLIGFESTTDGGRCSPGCHARMEYRRSRTTGRDKSTTERQSESR